MEYKRLTLIYDAALKQLETKMDVINNEFKTLHKYNPIEHITSRIKSKESINKKLKKKGLELTQENLVKTINDVAGIRPCMRDVYVNMDSPKSHIVYRTSSGHWKYHL